MLRLLLSLMLVLDLCGSAGAHGLGWHGGGWHGGWHGGHGWHGGGGGHWSGGRWVPWALGAGALLGGGAAYCWRIDAYTGERVWVCGEGW